MPTQTITTSIDPTVPQTAKIFQTTPKTIYARIKDGTLESYLFGRSRRVKSKSIARARGESE